MAITCPQCGADFDVTLFQFGHGVRCDCGAWVELDRGHVVSESIRKTEGESKKKSPGSVASEKPPSSPVR